MPRPRTKSPRAVGFPPIAAPDALALILGSMPSVASLAKREYYGHPRNAFWPILGRLIGAGPEVTYAERTRRVLAHRLAIWDVLRECRREGSLDSSILADSESANDLAEFLRCHRQIRTVFFNGGKAESAFRRHALAEVSAIRRAITYVRLPSTSPAHAGRNLTEKLAAWQAVRQALDFNQRDPAFSAASSGRSPRPSAGKLPPA